MKRSKDQNAEYKSSWWDEQLKWMCDFANTKGGTLYIGIDDGNVCGVQDAKRPHGDIRIIRTGQQKMTRNAYAWKH